MIGKDTTYKRSDRESRGELLRLVCMLMIVLHHFAVHCLYPHIISGAVPTSWDEAFVQFTHSFIFIGVNCFILLSGYYGIKVNLKSFIRLYLFLSFYALLDTVGGGGSIARGMKAALFPYSSMLSSNGENTYWFLKAYVALYFISPVLNAAKQAFDKKSFAFVCALLLIMQVYFGDLTHVVDESGGYSLLNFILLYIIGGYIYRFIDFEKLKSIRYKSLLIYAAACVLWGIFSILKVYHCAIRIPHWHAFAYNNAMILIASIAFFLFMMSCQFKNRVINWLAVSCLAVYVIQDNHLFEYQWFAQGFWGIDISVPGVRILYWLGISVLFFFSALLFDKIRVIIQYPIEWLLQKLFNYIKSQSIWT